MALRTPKRTGHVMFVNALESGTFSVVFTRLTRKCAAFVIAFRALPYQVELSFDAAVPNDVVAELTFR